MSEDHSSDIKSAVPTDSTEIFEQERFTRREALRKFGITTGMGLFMFFGVDSLARLVGSRMEQSKVFGQMGDSLAREFRNAGVAFASASGASSPSYNFSGPCNVRPSTWKGQFCKLDCLMCCTAKFGQSGTEAAQCGLTCQGLPDC